ncbi:hypothetical protein JNM05_06115 [bacterium]|nr:hypothetical protein [bacterium]
MPTLSVWLIRCSLAYLGLGFTIGALILFNKAVPVIPSVWNLLQMHIEFLLLGFILQLTMGVAFWIFPRLQTMTDRGDERKAALAFVLLNAGIWVCSIAPFISISYILLTGRICQTAAVILFILNLWPRVYAFGKY